MATAKLGAIYTHFPQTPFLVIHFLKSLKPVLSLSCFIFAASTPPLGAILAALIAGFVLQKYGRKITLLISVAVTFFTFLILATSKIHEIPGE